MDFFRTTFCLKLVKIGHINANNCSIKDDAGLKKTRSLVQHFQVRIKRFCNLNTWKLYNVTLHTKRIKKKPSIVARLHQLTLQKKNFDA